MDRRAGRGGPAGSGAGCANRRWPPESMWMTVWASVGFATSRRRLIQISDGQTGLPQLVDRNVGHDLLRPA
jgi:hypothetical protein